MGLGGNIDAFHFLQFFYSFQISTINIYNSNYNNIFTYKKCYLPGT